VKGSLPYTGWENRDTDPVNDLYSLSDPDPAPEDVSHFSLTLHFMVEAWQMGVVFQEDDLKAVAQTFTKRLWNPSDAKTEELCDTDWRKGFYLAHNLDGKYRAYDYAAGAFAPFSRWEPSILDRALAVYESRYKDVNCIDIDYLYGEVMLGWSILALKGELPIIAFREKPLYPFTLRSSAEEYVQSSRLVSLDEHGIPVTDYGSLYGGAGRRYNPTFIANYALALYRDYLATKDSALLQAFQKQVQWFLEHGTKREYHGFEFWVWEFDFDNPLFGAVAPWVSALSQGRVLCVFLAAYDLSKEPQYLRAAELAYRSFIVPTSAGGVTTFSGDVAWYEEAADEVAPSAKILNGHIAALQGLWTFWKWTGRADVKRYLDLGIAAVKRDIALYDAGFLSYYSQYPTSPREYAPARDYNTLHTHQLLWLYEVTAEPVFLEFALRFAQYDTPGWEITVAGSTDPVGHGPDNLFFEMGSKYWSHNQFPTWVQLDLGEPQLIEGIVLFGYTPKSTPRDFQVFVSEDGNNWRLVLEKLGNEEQHIIQRFEPLLARLVKVVIQKDNGNNNVAL
ncbi:MAG: D-glucuronyl C5-epimerase family protein, partial [Armatimonadota bacterium]